jgi:hypothetical protein
MQMKLLSIVGFGICVGCGSQQVEAPGDAQPRAQASASSEATARKGRCKADSCDLRTNVCCESDKEHRCVSRSEVTAQSCDGGKGKWHVGVACLSADDCASGQRCCADPTDERNIAWCSDACVIQEACAPGGKCRAGFRCVADKESRTGAHCAPEKPGAPCDGARCTGDTPVCCRDPAKRSGKCIAEDAPCEGSRLACGDASDCSGNMCCLYVTGFSGCEGTPQSCAIGSMTCRTLADCPESMGQKPKRCAAATSWDTPTPMVKICVY